MLKGEVDPGEDLLVVARREFEEETGSMDWCAPGNRHRQRFNRWGNRQLNTAIHRIGVTQLRIYEPARDYVARKRAEGKDQDRGDPSVQATHHQGGVQDHDIDEPADRPLDRGSGLT